jgi:hypothetical protein
MRILFDKSAPYGLARYLEGHAIAKAEERGWGRQENGVLLNTAEEAGFEVFLTTDKNLRYQQNLSGRKIALVVLGNSLGTLYVCISPRLLQRSMQRSPVAMSKWTYRFPPSPRLYDREP